MPKTTLLNSKETIVVKRHVGWSTRNVLTGLALLFVGFIIWFGDSVVEGFAQGVAGKKIFIIGFWGKFGFAIMAIGVLGYWMAIPAVQKWWDHKRRMALIFLIPTVLIGILIISVIFSHN
ncbi:MAG TPA: hypothetical protein VMU70_01450 [Candidatus Tyrphobacter sp.]|nr:hypothetical protein [Candidatus Tyrphobacter sp.]